ncbi:hypothetical protein [Candidatus Nitrosocosmicus franklandus]|uniref:Uncharacterized protein n=1 Tax=Candidatus Nitrosocosmicus franklandianus TaxID=1798806 RepID=A0A484I611_9ARCH|nr:hypothetical protein [Candidatus Nitrosocosmicus franklandus]VFJ13169.1 conserved exported protein of unknown function [Candidatus Nitrosocosmicus franklandus]
MNKSFVGILSVFLAVGLIGVYVPNAFASILERPGVEACGNIAAGQQPNSDAEQEVEQGQASEADGQAVAPEFNALNANNLNLGLQENGECIPTFDQPPTDSTLPAPQ